MSTMELTLLVNKIEKLTESINGQSGTNYSRKDLTAVIVGSILGAMAGVPAIKPQNKKIYYTAEVLPKLLAVFNAIVEQVILNVDLMTDVAYNVWSARYAVVHPHEVDLLAVMRLVSSYESENGVFNTLADLKENSELTELVTMMSSYIKNLKVV